MIRGIKVAVSLCLISFALGAESAAAATLGETANTAQLVLLEGTFDPTSTPYPVSYAFSQNKEFKSAPADTIHESITTINRTAMVDVAPGIIKASASSSGITGGYYVHGAYAGGSFVDTFTISSASEEWVDVTVRLWVDGTINSSGPTGPVYNRALVQGFFNMTTARGGQKGGSMIQLADYELFPTMTVKSCIDPIGQVTCGYGRGIAGNSSRSFDGQEFRYTATVKTNAIFTLEVGMAAAAYSLTPSEWATSDFASTAIFGGLQVAPGFSVSSASTGGLLETRNGVANYASAFTALEAKYGTAVPGVPEPGTWAMMIAGLSGIGAILRRPRRSACFA